MASGRPDYFRGVDITYQTLGEVINRPKYGGAIRTLGVGEMVPNTLNELISVAGKGMIYGCALYLMGFDEQHWSYIELKLDGETLMHNSFYYLRYYGLRKHGGYPLVLSVYDEVNFRYGVEISYGLTFEESLVISYKEQHGGAPNVVCYLIYALI